MSTEPTMTDFTLLVTLHDKSEEFPNGKCKATVGAFTLQEACRAIIHREMAKGRPVRKIRLVKNRNNQ